MKHRLLCLTLCLIFMLSCSVIACADTAPIIRDDANLLTEAEEAELYTIMEAICDYGTPMLWTTTASGNDSTLVRSFYREQIRKGLCRVVMSAVSCIYNRNISL